MKLGRHETLCAKLIIELKTLCAKLMEDIDLCAKLITISESVSLVDIGYKVSMCAGLVYHIA